MLRRFRAGLWIVTLALMLVGVTDAAYANICTTGTASVLDNKIDAQLGPTSAGSGCTVNSARTGIWPRAPLGHGHQSIMYNSNTDTDMEDGTGGDSGMDDHDDDDHKAVPLPASSVLLTSAAMFLFAYARRRRTVTC